MTQLKTIKDWSPIWIAMLIIIFLAFLFQYLVDYQAKECDNIINTEKGCEYEKCAVKEWDSNVNKLKLIDCLLDKGEIKI